MKIDKKKNEAINGNEHKKENRQGFRGKNSKFINKVSLFSLIWLFSE